MSEWIDRMAEESEQLEARLQKLGATLMFEHRKNGPIPVEQYGLMSAQYNAMRCYQDILQSRLYLAREREAGRVS